MKEKMVVVRVRGSRTVGLALGLFVLLLITPSFASATPTSPIGVLGQACKADGSLIAEYGTAGKSYLYPEPSPLYGNHWVNSLYANTAIGNDFEAGWYWDKASGTRVWFWNCWKNGVDYEGVISGVPNWSSGSWIPIAIERLKDGTNNDTWEVYLSGTDYCGVTSTGVTSSYPQVGAEIHDTSDTAKGSWQNVQYMHKDSLTSYTWYYWPNAFEQNVNDPSSHFYTNHLQGSNHWVYVDTHQD